MEGVLLERAQYKTAKKKNLQVFKAGGSPLFSHAAACWSMMDNKDSLHGLSCISCLFYHKPSAQLGEAEKVPIGQPLSWPVLKEQVSQLLAHLPSWSRQMCSSPVQEKQLDDCPHTAKESMSDPVTLEIGAMEARLTQVFI